MTLEEIQEAYREKTWLVWFVVEHTLVHVYDKPRAPFGWPYAVQVLTRKGNSPSANIENLRIATPNDMLKYGE